MVVSIPFNILSTPVSLEVLLPCLHSLAKPVHFAQIFLGTVASLDHHQQICKAMDQMGLPREKADGQLSPTSLSPLTLMQNSSRTFTGSNSLWPSAWFPDASPGTPGGVLIYFPLKWVMMASHFSVDSILRSTRGVRL